jgi:hypothetical protein
MIPQVLSSNYELGHNHHTPPAMVCDKRKLYSSTFASDLALLMDLRHTADYRVHDLGKRQTLRALNKASRFVNAVKKRIFHG